MGNLRTGGALSEKSVRDLAVLIKVRSDSRRGSCMCTRTQSICRFRRISEARAHLL